MNNGFTVYNYRDNTIFVLYYQQVAIALLVAGSTLNLWIARQTLFAFTSIPLSHRPTQYNSYLCNVVTSAMLSATLPTHNK